ncbi:hypothetical protein PLICRDRAFT_183796 [Plicaturopsis crispa FD-325 SS-3]|nr:hypothetical protein PLICRDRAFT_183796 [Plicaturopsis crispa FD-325 SS-3]
MDIYRGRLQISAGDELIPVAVKVLRIPWHDTTAREALRKAIGDRQQRWSQLHHVNVAAFFGVSYERPHAAALVMPLYGNGSAIEYLKGHTMDIVHLLADLSKGLVYLHAEGIIHGDIRGSNVFIADNGTAVLADYDLHPLWNSTEFTTTSIVGPARWQAPEIFLNEEDAMPFTEKSDVFSFAMLAIELLTLDKPFANRKLDTVAMFDIIKGRRPAKPVANPFADKLWPILTEAWAQESDARPSARELSKWLATLE